MNSYSFKTNFGWITVKSLESKLVSVKFGKTKNLENYQNSGKIYVSNSEKIIETFLSIFDLVKLSLKNEKYDQVEHDHNLINEEINLDERI